MSEQPISKLSSNKWRGYVLNVLVIVVVVAGIRLWQQRDMANGVAPELKGVTLEQAIYSLPAHPTKPMLVHFWATWCPICRTEQGNIAAIARDYPNTITVAMNSGLSNEVKQYMKDQGIDFPTVNDPDGTLSAAWGVHAVPASFIVAPNGKIEFVEVGYTTELGLRFRLWWAQNI
ncbi:MAG: protein disulfide oxidoreductase [Sideroxydans sp.]|nr:protein disulfide oxidoreductase [Sideroxydans sp.]